MKKLLLHVFFPAFLHFYHQIKLLWSHGNFFFSSCLHFINFKKRRRNATQIPALIWPWPLQNGTETTLLVLITGWLILCQFSIQTHIEHSLFVGLQWSSFSYPHSPCTQVRIFNLSFQGLLWTFNNVTLYCTCHLSLLIFHLSPCSPALLSHFALHVCLKIWVTHLCSLVLCEISFSSSKFLPISCWLWWQYVCVHMALASVMVRFFIQMFFCFAVVFFIGPKFSKPTVKQYFTLSLI